MYLLMDKKDRFELSKTTQSTNFVNGNFEYRTDFDFPTECYNPTMLSKLQEYMNTGDGSLHTFEVHSVDESNTDKVIAVFKDVPGFRMIEFVITTQYDPSGQGQFTASLDQLCFLENEVM